jgi:Transcriptional regulator/sugar kinase
VKKKYAIGADIGGSHISAVLMDIENEKIEVSSIISQKVDNKASSEEILTNWKEALAQTLAGIDVEELKGIGFAMPGPFEYETGIARFTHEVAKYENLNGVNVETQLKELMNLPEEMPLRFMNDATSFAVGEAWTGSISASKRSVALTLGTGFGSAFIDSGVPVLEGDDVPKLGCLWHLPYKNGIGDDYFSTRWYINRYAEKTGKHLNGVKEIAAEALTDPNAKALFDEFGSNMAEFLGPWLRKFKADSLVIGGNMTGAYNLFGPAFIRGLQEQNITIEVHLSKLMESAAMIGSARLLNDSFWQKVKPLLSKM